MVDPKLLSVLDGVELTEQEKRYLEWLREQEVIR